MSKKRSSKKIGDVVAQTPISDLVVLVADQDMEETFHGLLPRHQSLRVRPFSFRVYRHSGRDAGCFRQCHEFLRSFSAKYHHALVAFDRDGTGKEALSGPELEREAESRLAAAGWQDRATVVVPVPELEIWVWSDSPNVDEHLGWRGRDPGLKHWLESNSLWNKDTPKPGDPKKAMVNALREARKPRSAAIFRKLAESVSLDRCQDAAFLKVKGILQSWFGSGASSE